MSRTSSTEEYEFRCPSCGESFRLNAPMRETVLTEGCPLCGRSASPADLSKR